MKKELIVLAFSVLCVKYCDAQNVFPSSGNVGIGTTTPAAKLDVIGITRSSAFTYDNTAATAYGFYMRTNTGIQRWATGFLNTETGANIGSDYVIVRYNDAGEKVNNGDFLIQRSSGNVGIGTTVPAYKLAVNGSVNVNAAPFTITNPASDNSLQLISGGTYNVISSYNLAGAIPKNLLINPDGGNIGIGTTNPGSYRLAVEGVIGAREIQVTGEIPWADYVFEPSYQLPSLQQVETFIQENKHLPDIPSAAEVKKEGLDLGANQAALLKKIEELTLYIIQQHKQIDQQNKQIDQQNKNMEQMEKRLAAIETK